MYEEPIGDGHALRLHFFDSGDTLVRVEASDRPKIESVFEVFEQHLEESRLPASPDPPPEPPQQPTIFIGHGRNPLWRELKDHLQDQHNHNVIAYEVGARAGHEIRDILRDMLRRGSFAHSSNDWRRPVK